MLCSLPLLVFVRLQMRRWQSPTTSILPKISILGYYSAVVGVRVAANAALAITNNQHTAKNKYLRLLLPERR
jgi:hypothetical protein